jgi:hypothetical protein
MEVNGSVLKRLNEISSGKYNGGTLHMVHIHESEVLYGIDGREPSVRVVTAPDAAGLRDTLPEQETGAAADCESESSSMIQQHTVGII